MSAPNFEMRVLPNGVLVPASYDPSKDDENAVKEQNCQKLKQELTLELKRSSFSEIKTLFEEKGAEFLKVMFSADPWMNVSNKGRSILEKALQEIRFNLPDETLLYLLQFFINNSEQAKSTNMNFLHVLARNCSLDKVITILKQSAAQNPELLKQRMKLDEDLDMTPVEMVIRTSYNEYLMIDMVDLYQKSVGILTSEDKAKLYSHAKWLSGSGIYSTSLMGVRMMERIGNLPEVI